MKLPAIPFLTKTFTTEYFLALIFESDKVSSILFKEQDKTLKIVANFVNPIDLEKASAEDLVVASDNVISKLEMSLSEGATLEKTIFAVPYSWVEEGKIKPERLSHLKKISTELALLPMGFIVSIEAIIAFLQRKEGAPISGIFVELSDKFLSVFVVRNGNIIDIKQGRIEDSVEKTVERLLGMVTKLDVLPSKIILLNNKEAELVQQKFLSHHWTKELSFIHLPQVAILEKGFENEAIINGVASQLNVSVSDDVSVSTAEEMDEENNVTFDENDNFGFVMDEDVALKSKDSTLSEDFHEVKDDQEVTYEEPLVRHHGVEQKEQPGEEIFEEDEGYEEKVTDKKGSLITGISGFFSNLITPNTFSRIFGSVGNGKKLIIPLIALVVVILFVIAYYSFYLKANVVIYTDQKAFNEDSLDISLTTSGESSFSDKTLKISTVDVEAEGDESRETTGQKDTGQKATGTITIFNKTESPKTLEKGAVITSSNNLEFTLNDDVKIASTSSFSTSFSSVQGKVTAANFGKEFNLPSQTNFTFKGISSSDVFAKNDQAFSGGNKEEIQVVAKKDLTALEETMIKRLFEDAKNDAEKDLSENDALIPNYLSVNFIEKKFDKKTDEEAKNIKLSAIIEYTMGIYKKDELVKFISSSSDFDVPPDFKLSDDDSSIKVTDIKQSKNEISAKLSFKAIFKPQFEKDSIPQLISGKGKEDALEKLESTSGVSEVMIQFPNAIPLLPLFIPINKDNITVELRTH